GPSEYVNERITNLINSGAEVISLTAVTMHIIYDRLTELSPMLPVSIPQTVSEETLKREYKCVGLLGTSFTMENDYMKKPLEEKGICVIVPEERDRKLVADRIANELEYGIVKESTLRELCGVINRMSENQGIEAVILGCTELPLILNSDVCPIECLDAVEIHINKLINLIDA
ncbi:MAG: aspartate/glutamate racemase family protein, partial [Huintestinicola sp.]